MIYIEAIGSILTLYAVYLLSEQIYLAGWIMNGIADLIWVFYATQTNQWSLAILQTTLLLLCYNGYRNNT